MTKNGQFTPIGTVKLNPNNPRTIKDDKFHLLVKNIAEFPSMLFKRGIVVDADNLTLGGNKRWEAILHVLKMPESELREMLSDMKPELDLWLSLRQKKSVPAQWIVDGSDFTPEQIERFIILDNVAFGQWDWDIIASDWDSGALAEWGLDVPTFNEPSSRQKEPKTVDGFVFVVNVPSENMEAFKSEIEPICQKHGATFDIS